MDQNEMSNLYRGPSIDASYQVSYHLAKRFQRKNCFRNQTIRNKYCLWRPCLLTDQNGMSNSHRGPSIDASYQISVYLVKLCQRRRFLEIDQSETRIVCGGHIGSLVFLLWTTWIIPFSNCSTCSMKDIRETHIYMIYLYHRRIKGAQWTSFLVKL